MTSPEFEEIRAGTENTSVCFDVILLALPYPSMIAMYAQLANLYVNLIGVVFATGTCFQTHSLYEHLLMYHSMEYFTLSLLEARIFTYTYHCKCPTLICI